MPIRDVKTISPIALTPCNVHLPLFRYVTLQTLVGTAAALSTEITGVDKAYATASSTLQNFSLPLSKAVESIGKLILLCHELSK
jgi:hypothetical protein